MDARTQYRQAYHLARFCQGGTQGFWHTVGMLQISFDIAEKALISFADRYNVDKYDDIGEWQRKYYAASEELQAWKRKYLKRYRISNRIAYAA